MRLCEQLQLTPLDFLATVMDLAGDEVEQKLSICYGHRQNTTLSLTVVKSGRSK